MIKILTIGVCVFFIYRMIIAPFKNLNSGNSQNQQNQSNQQNQPNQNDVIDIDYEEVE